MNLEEKFAQDSSLISNEIFFCNTAYSLILERICGVASTAIAQYSGYEQVVLLALQAGVDVLAIANQL